MKIKQILLATLLSAATTLAQALDIQPYTAATLAAAQKADKPVALHFHADWCPTCRAQTKVLQELQSGQGLNLTILVANYDTEKALKRRFNVNVQSTLVVLKSQKEVGRLVGDTTPDGIRTALKSAL